MKVGTSSVMDVGIAAILRAISVKNEPLRIYNGSKMEPLTAPKPIKPLRGAVHGKFF